MSGNENNTLNNTVETPENSFSKGPLWQKIESLEKEIKSLRKQNRLNNSCIIGLGVIGLIGYIIATNWSAIASAATATVAAAPVIGIVIGAIIGAAVLVGASYAAWRYRAEIKAGAVYAKDSVKKGYENSVNSLKRGAGKVKSAIGSALETVGHKISSTGEDMNTSYKLTDSTDTGVLLLTEDGKKEYNSIRNALRNISDKHLLEKISSEMVSLIDSKIESEKNMIDFQNKGNLHKSEALISRWIKQKNSIVELDPKGLQKRLAYEGYDHDLYQIFSEHHSEIKEVIKDESTRFKAIGNLNKAAGAYLRMNRRGLAQSTPPSLSRSSSLSSLNSTSVDLSEPPKVPKSPTSGYGSKRSSPISSGGSTPGGRFVTANSSGESTPGGRFVTANSSGESTPISGLSKPVDHKALTKELEELRELSSGSSVPPTPPKPPVPPKPLAVNLAEANERKKQQTPSTSRSGSPDSGIDLPNSSPIPVMLTEEGGSIKTQANLRKTGRLGELVGQPSTTIDVNTDVQRQTILKTV